VRRAVILGVAAVLTGAAGCKLSEEVAAPPGESTVIAHMVLNTAAPVQKLLLERSEGSTSRVPLTGAAVRLTHLNPDASCARPTVTLVEANDSIIWGDEREVRRTYQTRDLCALRAGDRVELRVETSRGELLTGTTTIPGASQTLVRVGATTSLAPRVLPLDRTRDSIHVEMTPRFARALAIEAMRKGGNPRYDNESSPVIDFTTDTMHATLAGSLLDPFEDEEEQTIFRAGVDYLFTFAATDTAYYDFVRSGADPFTGRGFINHLSGGIGVFGSVAPQTWEVRVTAPQKDPREGIYRVFGPLPQIAPGRTVDARWDVYLDAAAGGGDFSALTEGTWVEGPVLSSTDGTFAGGFHARFFGVPADPLDNARTLYLLDYNGQLPPRGTAFTATLTAYLGNRRTSDRVSVVQVSGP
jgi:hypothetical protein